MFICLYNHLCHVYMITILACYVYITIYVDVYHVVYVYITIYVMLYDNHLWHVMFI